MDKEPAANWYKHISAAIYKYGVPALDKVYHTSSMHEMVLVADMENVDLHDLDALLYLIHETTYHDAFWPHTAPRYKALKNLLRFNKDIEHASRSVELVALVT